VVWNEWVKRNESKDKVRLARRKKLLGIILLVGVVVLLIWRFSRSGDAFSNHVTKRSNMGNKLYVGNLPFSATDDSLREMFGQAGQVESARIITDRDTGRSKGFGFVEMSTQQEASDAINKFNGADFDGRSLTVNEARPMQTRDTGGGGYRGGGGRQRW